MRYKGVTYSKSKEKFIAQSRFNGTTKIIGAYKTAEEARDAYINFKMGAVRELTPNDKRRLAQYKEYIEFCKEERLISEYFARYKRSSSSTVRYVLKYLTENGFIQQKIVSIQDGVRDIYSYTALKEFQDSDLVPRATSQALNGNYEMKRETEKPIAGARIIRFEDKTKESQELGMRYKEQQAINRKNAKSPKMYVSGASLSSNAW